MPRLHPRSRALVALAAAFVASAPAMAGNLIANGKFEGEFALAGWDVDSSAQTFLQVKQGPWGNFLYIKDAPVTLSQSFADTAGDELSIQAEYALQQTNPNQPFSVLFDGRQIFSTTTRTGGWDLLDIDVRATGEDTLTFDFATHNLALSTAMQLGDVGVQVSAVPEPAPVLMVGLGMAGLLFAARRRRDCAPARPALTN